MAIPEIQRAVRHMRAGEAEEAIPLLERVVEHMPQYVTAHVLLARMYEATSRIDDALHTWRHAYFFMRNSPVVQEGLHRVLLQKASPSPNVGNPEAQVQHAPTAATAATEAFIDFDQSAYPRQAGAGHREEDGVQDKDLDALIEELESARIVPRPDLDDIPAPELNDDIDDVVSETLARIYISQEQYGEAARVYDKLAEQKPEQAEAFEQKAAELREKADE